jgi:hypothetical protein
MENVKKWLGLGVPGGVDDVIIRAIKAAIFAFIGVVGADLAGVIDPTTLDAGIAAALSGAAAVIGNTVLLWASK